MTTDAPSRTDGSAAIARAIQELADRLPAPVKPLAQLAYNYRWCWMSDGAYLFRHIDEVRWRRSGCNPRVLIETTPPRRLQELAQDAVYLARLHGAFETLEAELTRPGDGTGLTPDRPVAYFCSEFGLHCSLPIYGGGLGILAGDMLKAASDMAVPMVGVGLLYREGYFHQRLDGSGWQVEYWINADFDRLPIVRVTGADHQPIHVTVMVRGRAVRTHVWRLDVGRVPLFLLDTDCPHNTPIDRLITSRLYVGDRHTRLAQYSILGIGGVLALEAMGITPGLVHLNEGHGALAALARARRLAAITGCSFDAALADVREETVFTTHTPVAAGNEGYSEAEIEPVFGPEANLGIPRPVFYDLGRVIPGKPDEPVSITPLALRTSRAANGVSKRHGEVARAMWQPMWPERAVDAVPISHVTNGVHTLTWMANPMQELLDRHLGLRWRHQLSDPAVWRDVDAIPDAELWAVRCTLRHKLVEYVRETSVRNRFGRGELPDYVEAAARMFSPNVLTVGFARRVATYKRLYLLTRLGWEAVGRLFGDVTTPVQLVTAGKAHPQDNEAKESLRYGLSFRFDGNIARRTVFLEDYDMHMAPRIVAGVDLWLNLPRPPMEASGTSGMKVVLNGGLNLSVLDGWWIEGYDGTNGWAIDTPEGDPSYQDDHDVGQLLDLVEGEVIPLFYARDADGVPRGWVRRMKASMRTLIPKFTAERMLQDYVTTMYRRPGT